MVTGTLFLLSRTLQLLFLPSLLMLHGFTDAQPLFSICYRANYTANSTFQTNLNHLLPPLSSNASITGFYNTSAGVNPNRVYGLALCRGDTTPQTCRNCVTSASREIIQNCPNSKTAIIWYDLCQLRYSNHSIISSVNNTPYIPMVNINNISSPDQSIQLVGGLLKNLSSKAAFGPSTRLFATGEANFIASQKIYGLVQCTQDLSRNDCNKCLEGAITDIQTCCGGQQGARILGTSCNLRYELYNFYMNSTAQPPALPPALPPASSSLPIPSTPSSSNTNVTAPSSPSLDNTNVTAPSSAPIITRGGCFEVFSILTLFILVATQ